MTPITLIRIAAVSAAAMALAPAALAAGEPKNEWPFTQTVADRAAVQLGQPAAPAVPDAFERYAATHPYGAGLDQSLAGETKNEAPFTRPVVEVAAREHGGFDWGDAGIGAAVTIGLVLALLGGVVLRAPGVRRPRPTSA